MKEIIFEIHEDEIDGGYNASALDYGIHTEADTIEDLRRNIKEAVACYFDETMEPVDIVRLHPLHVCLADSLGLDPRPLV
jgi:predicted RNase H-like HicB family nuclease